MALENIATRSTSLEPRKGHNSKPGFPPIGKRQMFLPFVGNLILKMKVYIQFARYVGTSSYYSYVLRIFIGVHRGKTNGQAKLWCPITSFDSEFQDFLCIKSPQTDGDCSYDQDRTVYNRHVTLKSGCIMKLEHH